jgi:hypothetical protein
VIACAWRATTSFGSDASRASRAIIRAVISPVVPVHSHTQSLRLSTGDEVLVVRVLTHEGVAGFGCTFNEDVAAARRMACWDAAAGAAGRPLWQLLRDAAPEVRNTLRAELDDGAHPWIRAWRTTLDAASGTPGASAQDRPGSGIDWTLEPGFMKLHWIDPEPDGEKAHGRTAD